MALHPGHRLYDQALAGLFNGDAAAAVVSRQQVASLAVGNGVRWNTDAGVYAVEQCDLPRCLVEAKAGQRRRLDVRVEEDVERWV